MAPTSLVTCHKGSGADLATDLVDAQSAWPANRATGGTVLRVSHHDPRAVAESAGLTTRPSV